MTLAQVRAELKGVKGERFSTPQAEAGQRGPRFWRSIDELAGTDEFQAAVEREFPAAAQEWVDPVSRRGFMKLMGASMALAGLAGCAKQPDEPIFRTSGSPKTWCWASRCTSPRRSPSSRAPFRRWSRATSFAPSRSTAIPSMPTTRALPTSSRRARCSTCTIPTARKHVTFKGENRDWAEFAQGLKVKMGESKDGTGIYFLTTTITSPTLARQWKAVQQAYPKATLVQYDPAMAGTASGQADRYRSVSTSAAPMSSFRSMRTFCRARLIPASTNSCASTPHGARIPARHEPAVCHREHADHHRHEGRASPRPARQRSSRICGGAGCGGGCCRAFRLRAMPGPPSSRNF